MALMTSPVNERKRVKVYELRDNDWFDRGTGFCAVQAISEDGRIWVTSEEDAEASLLDVKIKKDDNYQKQQETLIVWTDPNGVDMALSFQEADGCGIVWDQMNEAQSQLFVPVTTFELPEPSLKELENIERAVRESSAAQSTRDMMTKALLNNNYVAKLTALVEDAEDLESIVDLHRLCTIMKQIILFNDNGIVEYIVQDEIIEGVVGALEYDPDFPDHKANHRQFLKENSRFKEVVQISDPDIRRKIHHTYRLQYLKDVALARVLDDPSFSLFNSLIYFQHIDIVQHVANDAPFLKELFEIIKSKDESPQRKKDAIVFIQQSCATAKSLQISCRSNLYANLLNCGLTPAISFALQHKDPSVRVAGTDILVALIDHDITMMRTTISRSANENTTPMTDTLIDLLLVEADIGIKGQVTEALKVLLDSNPPNSPGDRPMANGDSNIAAKFTNSKLNQVNKIFVEDRLQPSMKKLFQPLIDLDKHENLWNISFHESNLYSHLVEILGFFIRQQTPQSKNFILSEGLIPRTARLLSSPEKHLRLTSDPPQERGGDHYIRHLFQHNLFATLLSILFSDEGLPSDSPPPEVLASSPRDNLINSAVLDIFEYIRQSRDLKLTVVHLVENVRSYFTVLAPHINLFNQLLREYDVLMDPTVPTPSRTQDMDSSFMTSEAGSPAPRHEINNAGATRWQGLKDDIDEEAYFAGGDDDADEDELSRDQSPSPQHLSNGIRSSKIGAGPHASPVRRLVEYGDEDDEDNGGDLSPKTTPRSKAQGDTTSIVETPPRASNNRTTAQSARQQQQQQQQQQQSPMTVAGAETSLSPSPTSPSPPHSPSPSSTSPPNTNSTDTDPSSATSSTTSAPRPMLSITEKRRREEDDDEDEMGKLAMNTRSGAASLTPNNSSTTSNASERRVAKRRNSNIRSSASSTSAPLSLSISSSAASSSLNQPSASTSTPTSGSKHTSSPRSSSPATAGLTEKSNETNGDEAETSPLPSENPTNEKEKDQHSSSSSTTRSKRSLSPPSTSDQSQAQLRKNSTRAQTLRRRYANNTGGSSSNEGNTTEKPSPSTSTATAAAAIDNEASSTSSGKKITISISSSSSAGHGPTQKERDRDKDKASTRESERERERERERE